MIILDDIKSLYKDLRGLDLHDHLAFNELGYGRRVGDRIYAFCPFCGKILEFSSKQVEEEVQGKPIRLKRTVSCDCRRGLRYLRKGILDIKPKRPGPCSRLLGKILGEDVTEEDPLKVIRSEILIRGDVYENKLKKEAHPKMPPTSGISQPLHNFGSYSYNLQSAYIPDDFEPDMDAYDREALYEEEMLDDWVIASGGNPFDFDDRVDAISDLFGFDDDFDGGDGFFD